MEPYKNLLEFFLRQRHGQFTCHIFEAALLGNENKEHAKGGGPFRPNIANAFSVGSDLYQNLLCIREIPTRRKETC
jgi:hypothetical protein